MCSAAAVALISSLLAIPMIPFVSHLGTLVIYKCFVTFVYVQIESQ